MALTRDMSEQQAFEVVQTLLDGPESRFPAYVQFRSAANS